MRGNRYRTWLPSPHEPLEALPSGSRARAGRPRAPAACPAQARAEARARPRAARARPRRRGHRGGRRGARLRLEVRPRRAPPDADRPEHVRLRGGRLAARRDPGRAESGSRSARQDVAVAPPGDGRHRGPPLLRPRRDRRGGHRPRAVAGHQGRGGGRGRLDDHPAARPQPLHLERADGAAQGHGGVPGREARRRLVEAEDPRELPQLGLLREPRLRRGGGIAHVLLPHGADAEPAAGCARRRAAAGPDDLRPAHRPRARAPASQPGPRRDAPGVDDHAGPAPLGAPAADRAPPRPALRADPRAVLLRLRPRPAREGLRRGDGPLGRSQGVHDDRAALAAARAEGDRRHAHAKGRSRRGDRLHRPRERRDPRDDGDRPGPGEQPVQPPLAGAPPAGLDLQDVRPRRRGRARDGPVVDLLRLRTVHVPPAGRRQLRRRKLVVRADLRLELHGLDLRRAGDPALRQLRLRAADARRRPGTGRLDGPPARRSHAAAGERRVPACDGARLGRGLSARHGVGLCHTRRRRHLHRAHRDPQGDPERQAGRPLGRASPPHARRSRRRRIGRDAHPRGQRSLRDGNRRGAQPARCGQDRHDRQARRCVVRRVHARPIDRCLDGLHARRGADDERPRHLRLGRVVPGADLAPVHGSRAGRAFGPRVPGARPAGGVPAVAPRAVGALVRPVLRGSSERADDHPGGDDDASAAEGHVAEGFGDAGAGRRAVAGRRGARAPVTEAPPRTAAALAEP